MSFVHDEFKDYLMKIADELQRDDYRSVIKSHLGASLDEVERAKINSACKRLMSAVGGDVRDEFIDNFQKRIEKRRKIEKKYGKELVSRQDAIDYTEQSESNFDKKVKEKDNNNITITYRAGKPYFSIDDLKKIMKLEIDSIKSALCINTHYQFDRKRDGFLPFRGGEYYKILDENGNVVWLYNEKWMATLRIPRNIFEINFRVEEKIKF